MATISVPSRGSATLGVRSRSSCPKIDIELIGQSPCPVNSYTTGDNIEGTVTVAAEHDTHFDEIEILFQGTSQTSVETPWPRSRASAQQVFLELRQPVDETEYPTPRVLQSGHAYQFPFIFVVPRRLLPQICRHFKQNVHVEHFHTMVPPTLGDHMLASNDKTLLHDMTPYTSHIDYMVRVSLLRKSCPEDRVTKTLAESIKKVRVIPIVVEEPPVSLNEMSGYCTRKVKIVKRGLLRGRQGRLTASAAQPKPVQLSSPSCEATESVSTVAVLHLRFDPEGNEQPPQLGSLTSELAVHTFYSVAPWEDLVRPSGLVSFSVSGRGLYTENVPLSTMCVASAQWMKHSDTVRRVSVRSTMSEELTTAGRGTYYTASVVIAITLPKTRAFVPTFQSCLMARIYSLELSLSYQPAGKTFLTPTVSLSVPIQITSHAATPDR